MIWILAYVLVLAAVAVALFFLWWADHRETPEPGRHRGDRKAEAASRMRTETLTRELERFTAPGRGARP